MNDIIEYIFIFIACLLEFIFGKGYGKYLQQDEIRERTEINGAYAELLHKIYVDDKEYWNNTIIPSQEYKQLDSLKQGDWEDFYLY